jgi:hypothetical protein
VAPLDVSDVHHGRVCALPQERERTGRKAAHSLIEFRPSPSEFLGRHLTRPPRRPANDRRDSTIVVE